VKHVLKTWREPFEAVLSGAKRFEWRKDDRCPAFAVGDELVLADYDMSEDRLSGREIDARVCYVLRGCFGMPEGYAILGLDCVRPRLTTLEEDRALVRRLLAIEEGLSEWEVGFVTSLSARVDAGQKLSDKQRERALQIDERP
jgi:hypothetical protein